jgi:PilZ domain-containing protein
MLFDNIRRLRRPESNHAAPGRRWKTNWPAEITSPAGRIPCTVLDISSWGAQLQLDRLPEERDRVWLVVDGIGTIAAQVVWQRDNIIGVQFVEQQGWIRRLHAQRLDPATWPAANS